ncbi:hypothetical protein PFICI_11802 [Pestalotiopsis fici W106-1]|uniref:Zn(2)-C6 fungal-type domain-containing protein n=1 Tax=Pestalotiopsis fici (strain W106-1 / CGMCC3.15140) TaxID=1229662 RepID=W3WRC1_PESFW|nr:uncharacterized protein PFICI_11802 [Pestalotiopsis fici W106-1]ETS76415.1 hypothetical protein PFICI_11802 [Pestalotiopsis fici W106-1]
MGRKRTACTACAAIKAACNKGRPCSRCGRLSLSCQYVQGDTIVYTGPEAGPQGAEAILRRSKAACLNCRRQRKKCDEQRPKCGNCSRLQLRCVLPPQQQRPSPSSELAVSAPAEDGHKRRLHFALFADWIGLVEYEAEPAPLTSSTSVASVSPALVDLPIPSRAEHAAYATFLPSTALNNLTGVKPGSLVSCDIGERHLWNHFILSVARVLVNSRDDARNPFLAVAVPMALDSFLVRHALLALSACHLGRVYSSFRHDLQKHRRTALAVLKEEMMALSQDCDLEEILMGTMLLLLTEICDSTSKKWLLYLRGAHTLLAMLPTTVHESRGSHMLLTKLYNHVCCIATITSNNVPDAIEFQSDLLRSELDGQDCIFGVHGLHRLLPCIRKMKFDLDHEPSLATDGVFQAHICKIELEIQSWAPHDAVNDGLRSQDIRAAAFCTQWALILYLNQTLRRLKSNDVQISKAADTIISALSLIRLSSEVEAHLLFPVFMAGVGSVTKANRLTVDYRLRGMAKTVGFGNINVAHGLLESIWQLANQGEWTDWDELMQAECPILVLF